MKYFLMSLLIHVLMIGSLAYQQTVSGQRSFSKLIVEVQLLPKPSNGVMPENQEFDQNTFSNRVDRLDQIIGKPEADSASDSKKQRVHKKVSKSGKNSKIQNAKLNNLLPKRNRSQKKVSLDNKDKNGKSAKVFLVGQDGDRTAESYAEELKTFLEQNKVYPRVAMKMKHSGTVKVRLQIRIDGKFGDIQVVSPSPYDSLNQAAVDLLRGLGQFKPLPSQFEREENFVIPIAYRLAGDS